jgi:hypothetical protein
MADELEVDRDALGCTNIGELFRHPFTIGSIRIRFLGVGKL